MAAAPVLISIDEYLRTSYRPDRDYIDGEVKKRNLGETPHSTLQGFFTWYFRNRLQDWGVFSFPEQRVQVSATRYRIPDVCLVSRESPRELIICTPPVLCIEILSREDRMNEVMEPAEDCLRMGVPVVWIVDPWRREARSVTPGGTVTIEHNGLRVPGTPIYVHIADLWLELDLTQTPEERG